MLEFKALEFPVIFFILLLLTSCNSQNQTHLSKNKRSVANLISTKQTKNIDGISRPIVYEADDVVKTALLDKNGVLWFGTTNEGVFRYDGKSFTNFQESDGLCSNYINSILEDKEGKIWFGTANGLCSYDGNSFSHIPIPKDGKNNLWGELCNSNQVLCMLQDKHGYLWLGTCGGGAYRYDGKTFRSFLSNEGSIQSDSLHHNVIKSMIEDKEGNIWFTSLTHGGVSRYDGESFKHFKTEDGLTDDMVFSSLQDKKGNIWFGSIQNQQVGLFRYDLASDRLNRVTKAQDHCDNIITGIFEDESGKLWFCTGKDLCYYDGKSFAKFQTKKGELLQDLSFVIKDKKGNLWFGGKYGRLMRYDGETLTDFTNKKS